MAIVYSCQVQTAVKSFRIDPVAICKRDTDQGPFCVLLFSWAKAPQELVCSRTSPRCCGSLLWARRLLLEASQATPELKSTALGRGGTPVPSNRFVLCAVWLSLCKHQTTSAREVLHPACCARKSPAALSKQTPLISGAICRQVNDAHGSRLRWISAAIIDL